MELLLTPLKILFQALSFDKAIFVVLTGLFIYMFKKIINKMTSSINNTEAERVKANEQIVKLATNHITHDIEQHVLAKSALENQTSAIKELTESVHKLASSLTEGRERAIKEHVELFEQIKELKDS